MTFGNHVLSPAQEFFWKLPVLWRLGNLISSIRFRLYHAYGWEWI